MQHSCRFEPEASLVGWVKHLYVFLVALRRDHIELEIHSDPRATSFICVIIVERGGREGGREERRGRIGMVLRFHSEKSGTGSRCLP